MAISTTSTISIVPSGQSSGGTLKPAANQLKYEGSRREDADLWGILAQALGSAQSQVDFIMNQLRSPVPLPDPIQITNPGGQLIVQLGHMIGSNNQSYSGIWSNAIYLGGLGPDTANVVIAGGTATFTDVEIILVGTNATITLDPTLGQISVVGTGGTSAINTYITAQTVGGTLSGLLMTDPANPTTKYLTAGFDNLIILDIPGGTDTQLSPGAINVESGAGAAVTQIRGSFVDSPAYLVGGVPGLSTARSFGTSLTLSTDSSAVSGTPGVGQGNFTAVTGVVLNLTASTFTGGLLTA